MNSVLRATIAVSLLCDAASGLAEPLKPTGPWHLYYLPSSCAAERPFGDYILGFEAPPLSDTTRFMVVGPGRSTESRQYDTLIELADGGPSIKSSSLVYGTSKKGRRGITTVLAPNDAKRMSASRWLRLSTLGTGPASKRSTPSSSPIFSAEFEVGSTVKLAEELAKCMDDLRSTWGMQDGKFPKPATEAELNLKNVFSSNDYPRDAMNADQTGSTKFLLMIDEKGAIMDCLVQETSGVASLDAMGCQVIKARGKAKPALDADGKPVKSLHETNVHWSISG